MIGNHFLSSEKSVESRMLGHDFTAFYSAGHFASLGQFDKLYDVQAVKDFEQEIGHRFGLSLGDAYGPYWNPPFYAWVFVLLAHFDYPHAILIWTLFNLACGLVATILLCRMLAPPRTSLGEAGISWRSYGLVPLYLLVSMPVIQALSHGQNTMTSLLLLTTTVWLWRRKNALWAGVVCGLLFYKPQLGAIVAAVLILTLGWRALAGLAITGTVLLLITLLSMPGALTMFIVRLPDNLRFMQVDHPYVWERHATIKAFWRLLFQGRGAGDVLPIVSLLTAVCLLILATSLLVALRRTIAHPERRDRLIAATIACMPLLMPFYFDYDLMLLAVPIVLFAGGQLRKESMAVNANADQITESLFDRWIVRLSIAMFFWMLINPGLAASTHINLTVPLLTGVTTLLLLRTIRPGEALVETAGATQAANLLQPQ